MKNIIRFIMLVTIVLIFNSNVTVHATSTLNLGNTSGNLHNDGFVLQDGDWIYYKNNMDSDKLYKIKSDGSGKQLFIGSGEIPAVPTNLTSTSISYNSIKTTWGTVAGANGYEVYMSTSSTGTYSLISTTPYTSCTNKGLTTGKTYYYKVRAYRTVGTTKVYSNYSSVVSAKPALSAPVSVKAVSYSYSILNTSWRTVSGARGYEVYRATSATGNYDKISTTTATSHYSTGLTTNRIYYYKVRAYITIGTTKVYSSYSSVASAKPIPATPPSIKATLINSKSIRLMWTGVTGANGYEVYRATSRTGKYGFLAKTTNPYYLNSDLITGKTYYYKIRAYRTVGKTKVYSGWTSIVSAKL
jgi:fibronectin type 3 domain-containing protein